ncbi:MAG: hypothetical protein HOE90_08040 [Bacteriovoracaceae bacterium]|jgi:ubiquinone biosynthesis protein|nr:hypothetical protein [Bacteriovoracaceae bacterium]
MVDLLKTGLGITRTIKNATRFREIVTVLARNGFDELIIKSGLVNLLPDFVLPKSRYKDAIKEKESESLPYLVGFRLRKSFEELGPGFVKIGQLASTRDDIFDVDFIDEMKKLRDQVKGIPFEEAREVIERQLGQKIEDVFESIDPDPIGTASIGVVYKGILKDGTDVVVKVRRPNIAKSIQTDFEILEYLVVQIEKVSEDIKFLGISKAIRDFGVTLHSELDFRIEALNCQRMKENIAKLDPDGIFYVPKIYTEFTKEEVLVMECLKGIPFTDSVRVNEVKSIIQEKLNKGLKIFIHTILADGFFHADLHGGNFFLLEDHRIGIIDFGLVGTLSKKGRTNLVAIMYSIVNHNYENLVYEFLDVAEYDRIPEVDTLIRDLKDALSPHIGLTVQQTNATQLFRSILETLSKHRIYLPREWFVVFRALITMDGVGKSLDMDFDIFGLVEDDIKGIIKEAFSKEQVIEEAVWIGRDLISSSRAFPRHLKWFLKEFSKNNYTVQVKNTGYEDAINRLSNNLYCIGMLFLSSVMFFSGTIILRDIEITEYDQIPILSYLFWGLSLALFLRTSFLFRKFSKY